MFKCFSLNMVKKSFIILFIRECKLFRNINLITTLKKNLIALIGNLIDSISISKNERIKIFIGITR